MPDKRSKTVLVTGGGSGGHITPLLAVADSLKKIDPAVRVIYVGQRGDKLAYVPAQHATIDDSHLVSAGKFRRYHGLGWRQLLKVRTQLLNIQDAFRVVAGIVQAILLLHRIKPDVVFIKGGFVGVPVGLAAAFWRIPFVTHDSDALPGLANRIVARWARVHAVALPKELYAYPPEKTVTVGVPIAAEYCQPITDELQRQTRARIGVDPSHRVVLVSGGGLGAQRINQAMLAVAADILHEYPDLVVVHQAGAAHQQAVTRAYKSIAPEAAQNRVHVLGFVTNLSDYVVAADVVVARAGGTSLAELAGLHQACIVIPNPYLTGGHQLQNAQALAERGAIRIVQEDALTSDAHVLRSAITDLLRDPTARKQLGSRLGEFFVPNASDTLARLLLLQAGGVGAVPGTEDERTDVGA